ncbi:MAG: transmembrane 220 family protein [Verrucomicrobiales bacterium]|nr:transmembrane 220 family protein [Verrucomicrobiales bacterium]
MNFSLPVRIATIVAALLFFVFAWFQRNDVDPRIYHNPSSLDAALWLLFYFLIGLFMLVALWRKIPLWLVAVGVIACLVEMIMTGPGLYQNLFGAEDFTMTQTSMSAKDPRVELTREFFGAVIALAGVAWIYLLHRKVRIAT